MGFLYTVWEKLQTSVSKWVFNDVILNEEMEVLHKKVKDLDSLKKDMNLAVDNLERQHGKKRKGEVNIWLEKVRRTKNRVGEREQQVRKSRYLPQWWLQWLVRKDIREVSELFEQGKFREGLMSSEEGEVQEYSEEVVEDIQGGHSEGSISPGYYWTENQSEEDSSASIPEEIDLNKLDSSEKGLLTGKSAKVLEDTAEGSMQGKAKQQEDSLPVIYACGLELANIVVNSGLLEASWNQISALNAKVNPSVDKIKWKISNEAGYTAIAFVTSPEICSTKQLLDSAELVSSETLKQQNFTHFESLCSKGNPSFSIHRAAIELFCRIFDIIIQLRAQIIGTITDQSLPDTSLIITGHSLGGSVAALFTLFLLDGINPKSKKLPLCITFGSPLIGDEGLQKAVSDRSRWSSCFLHVAGSQDQVPSLLASELKLSLYRPFGSFLFCSEVGFDYVEDPESVLLLMEGLRSTKSLVSCEVNYYGNMVGTMSTMFLVKRNSQFGASFTTASQAGIILELEAVGITMTPEQEQNIKSLIQKLEHRERQIKFEREVATTMSPSMKLNLVKKKMAYLEWYKKGCKANKKGYYDSYKMRTSASDINASRHKIFLQIYWQQLVDEADRNPQKGAYIRDAWLFAGTNYRRMVEPLDIAEYYRQERNYMVGSCREEGNTYRIYGRSKHYILLEQWHRQAVEEWKILKTDPIKKRRNVAGKLTEDSCFFADVEEALISTKRLTIDGKYSIVERQSVLEELARFEQTVMAQIGDSAVSPEIFLEHGIFRTWWNEYMKIKGPSYISPLANFMRNRLYERYANGEYWENDMQI